MVKRILFPALLTVLCVTTRAQQPKPGQWRAHLPYMTCKSVVEGNNKVYAVSDQSIFTVDLYNGNVIEKLSKVDGLSDVGAFAVDYEPSKDIVILAYSNTNIDLIKGKDIYNIPDILMESILGLKEINSIRASGNVAFLSCSFGLVEIDLVKYEVKEFYENIGPGGSAVNIRSCTLYGDSIYIATDNGMRRARYGGTTNLHDFAAWSNFGPALSVRHVITYNGKLYADMDSVVQVYNSGSWNVFNGTDKRNTVNMRVCHNKLVVSQSGINGRFVIEDAGGGQQVVPDKFFYDGIVDKNSYIWFGNDYGLIRMDAGTNEQAFFQPNGPRAETSYAMLGYGNEMWVTSGGISYTFSPLFLNNGYYWFRDNQWNNKKDHPLTDPLKDYCGITRNEQNGHFFMGTAFNGVVETDANGVPLNHYTDNNSSLTRFGNVYLLATGVAMDKQGNLWVTNYAADSDSGLSVMKKDGSWLAFRCASKRVLKIIIDDLGQKWMVSQGNSSNFGLVVYDDNGTIDDMSDDNTRTLTDQQGAGHLPSPDVKCIAKDKDGTLWVGTSKGIGVIYNPGNVFVPGANFDAQQIIIGKGSNAGYLLGTEVINDIVIDGANRKWVATNNGAWLVAADGSHIIQHFDITNSPLFSNTVNCIGIIPNTGEVFFGTLKGIVSYKGDATEGGEVHKNVKVFPNPVKPGFTGVVSITGLPANASVKITDISGNLVYETIANGGMVNWDCRNFKGEKPSSGVYLIFTASPDGSSDYVSKLLILN